MSFSFGQRLLNLSSPMDGFHQPIQDSAFQNISYTNYPPGFNLLFNQSSMDLEQFLLQLRSRRPKGNFEKFVDNLNMYFIPAIIIVGICGNIMSALVFSVTHLRRLTSSLYLTWLSFADVSFLLALGVAWLDRVGVHWLTTPGWCQLVVYITRVCGCLSVWLVFSFTMERYIIVYHVLRKDMLATRHKAKVVIASLGCASMLLYTYIFVTYDVIVIGPKKMCGPNPKYHDLMTVMTSINTTISCIIPSICILIFNIRIIFRLHSFQKQRMHHFARYCNIRAIRHNNNLLPHNSVLHNHCDDRGNVRIKFSSSGSQQLQSQQQQGQHDEEEGMIVTRSTLSTVINTPEKCPNTLRYRSQLRTARMLLALSSIFVLFNLPSQIFHVQALMKQLLWDSIKTPRIQYKVHEFFEIFFFLNFAINFFVYSLCGQHFRTGLKRLYKRVQHSASKCLRSASTRLCTTHRTKEVPTQHV